MSGVPVVLEGAALRALVVGGGPVAARRAGALAASGARVRVIAPEICDELRRLAAQASGLSLVERAWAPGDTGDASVVIAATSDRAVNAAVAAEAMAAGRLTNVADAPEEGNCAFAAAHAAGSLVVGVTAGGVPGAAARIRDAIAERFGAAYVEAVHALGELRARLLRDGRRDDWRRAAADLVGDDFCELVESGELARRAARWG